MKKPVSWEIAIVIIVLWALVFLNLYTMGGFIHSLFLVAVVAVLVWIIQDRQIF